MKLSVIIPVYNVEDYLEACIDSCLKQNMAINEFEIILVDDGSDDSSLTICKRYAEQHHNIHAFSQKNARQGSARNLGLKHASGEYIWFVDADDMIREYSLAQLYQEAKDNMLDMLAFRGAEMIAGQPVQISKHNQLARGILAGRDFLFYDFSVCVMHYIFRKEFLDTTGLRFMAEVFHEDEDFMLKALYKCGVLGFLDRVLYFVTIRQGSTTRSVNPQKAYDLIEVSESLSAFMHTQVESAYRRAFHDRISLLINSMMFNVSSMSGSEVKAFSQQLHRHSHLFRHMRRSRKITYRIEGWLYLLFPKRIISLYKLAKRYL